MEDYILQTCKLTNWKSYTPQCVKMLLYITCVHNMEFGKLVDVETLSTYIVKMVEFKPESETQKYSQCQTYIAFYSIFAVSSDNFRNIKFVLLAFFEAKLTKIDILNPKLIVPDDYQRLWVHFEWLLARFIFLKMYAKMVLFA